MNVEITERLIKQDAGNMIAYKEYRGHRDLPPSDVGESPGDIYIQCTPLLSVWVLLTAGWIEWTGIDRNIVHPTAQQKYPLMPSRSHFSWIKNSSWSTYYKQKIQQNQNGLSDIIHVQKMLDEEVRLSTRVQKTAESSNRRKRQREEKKASKLNDRKRLKPQVEHDKGLRKFTNIGLVVNTNSFE